MTTLADTVEESATPKAFEVADWACDKLGVTDAPTREDARQIAVHAVGFLVGFTMEKAVPLLQKLAGRKAATPTTVTASVTVAPAAK